MTFSPADVSSPGDAVLGADTGAPTTRREALARERALASRAESTADRPVAAQPADVVRPVAAGRTKPITTARPFRAMPAAASRPAAIRRTTRGATARRASALVAMLFVGATIVSTSVPANAWFVDTPDDSAVKLAVAARSGVSTGGVALTRDASAGAAAQDYVSTASGDDENVGRDGYRVTQPVITSAGSGSTSGISVSDAAVQWPFPGAVPISSGFGARQVANCSFCSTFHEGLDFTPGMGTPIHVVADGVVTKVDQGTGALGYNVWVDHVIDGQTVTTVYAHMIAGSITVAQGQQIKVGQVVGQVGSTGNSTGAHLHFEVHLAGVPVDPLPWLQAHAGAA